MRARIDAGAGAAVEVERVAGALFHPFIEDFFFVIRRVGFGNGAIAPLRNPFVIGADVGHQVGDPVAGLGDIVEARIIHDGGCGTHFVSKSGGAQGVYRVGRAGAPVVREAEGMPYFMRRYKPDQPAHHFVFEFYAAGVRIDGGRLDEIPVAEQIHHVVKPSDVAFQNLAGPWVVNVGAVGVLYGG